MTPEELFLKSLTNKFSRSILLLQKSFSQKDLQKYLNMTPSMTSTYVNSLLSGNLIKVIHSKNIGHVGTKTIYYTTIYDKFTFNLNTTKMNLMRRRL